jgi:2,3-bisphosphoglycerate-independent phosphoglycerate mutase
MKSPTVLVILDGFGHSDSTIYNAVAQARTPTLDYLQTHYPHTLLQASGNAVGLLDQVQGNSEVGHITIGAGRIVDQPIKTLHDLINEHKLETIPAIKKNFELLARSGNTLHIMGLISDAGVHAHIDHMIAFINIANHYGIKHIALHCFLDGRDSPPQSAQHYLTYLEKHIKNYSNTTIASMCGRFYAMDRNNEWQRTQQAYDMLTTQQKSIFHGWRTALAHYCQQKIYDEFIPPTQLAADGTIKSGDGIVFINTRPDRARQLTSAFVTHNFSHFPVAHIPLCFFITPTAYNKHMPTSVLIESKKINNTLMSVLCEHNFSLFTIAETEKYAHVTYFFNSGRENVYANETRILVPSISAHNYKNIPEMQAAKITQEVITSLANTPADFYLINYANPDLVGHSGDLEATIHAIEFLDKQLAILYQKIIVELRGTVYITADHGKAELMYNETLKQPCTAHTTNPVPFIMVNQEKKDSREKLPLKELKDIAPFILKNLNIPIPPEMQN